MRSINITISDEVHTLLYEIKRRLGSRNYSELFAKIITMAYKELVKERLTRPNGGQKNV